MRIYNNSGDDVTISGVTVDNGGSSLVSGVFTADGSRELATVDGWFASEDQIEIPAGESRSVLLWWGVPLGQIRYS